MNILTGIECISFLQDIDSRGKIPPAVDGLKGGKVRQGGHPWHRSGSTHATAKSNSWFLYRLIFGERDRGRFQLGIAPS